VYRPDAPPTTVRLVDVQPSSAAPLADSAWIRLTQEIAGTLYVAVDTGRRRMPPTEPEAAAQHHLIIATAAIAAAEMETLAALCALGLHPPAQIHARAIGLLARNAIVFHENAALALECYDSLEASRRELSRIAQRILVDPHLDELLEQRYESAAGASMRRFEQTHAASFQRGEHYLINAFEQNEWSKWAHGDIVALANAGDSVRTADADLRGTLVVKPLMAVGLLFRTGLFSSVLLAVLADRGCLNAEHVRQLIARHRALTTQMPSFRTQRLTDVEG
jgi:hypothetical protein